MAATGVREGKAIRMKEIKISPKFSIGDHVYLNVEGGEPRLITDVLFTLSTGQISYQVMGSDGNVWVYSSNELVKDRVVL